ncbi:hypothetical protein JTE90_020415 [Oedothorax gibbosus]|uniref:Sushi domain-containing protein n=1 Tax=Oedothorax gibbosus TaxID=931172 RepID=A0AAV6UEI0_9ARAC|nr:hypothetical protein JTE90_020415 [Oedothorax gibbosus]
MTWDKMPLLWILFLVTVREIASETNWCGYPGAPAFGRPLPLKERYRPGDGVAFACEPGYALQGAPLQRQCTHEGTWAGDMPLCDRPLSWADLQASSRQTLSLYPAQKASDGDVSSCAYTEKLRPRWLRLDMGAEKRVRAVAITVPRGMYAQDAAQLTIYAISVRDSTTASYHKCATFSGRFASQTLRVQCAGGGVEGRYVHIEDNRRQTDYFSLCEIHVYAHKGSYECGEPERPLYGYSVRTETGAVNYRCLHGYRLQGPASRTCDESGKWQPREQPICVEITCPLLPTIPHGRLVYSGVTGVDSRPTLGSNTNLTCDYGFEPTGSAIVCGEDGRWIPLVDQLSCQPVDCGPLPSRHSSERYVLLNGTRYGGVAILSCSTSEEGEEELIYCREDGKWTTPRMDCSPKEIGLSRLGLVEEDQGDVPTGAVIGMAVVVFLLLLTVIFVLLLKRRKVLRQNSADSLPRKEKDTPSNPDPAPSYDNDAFYATIPPPDASDSSKERSSVFSTIIFPNQWRRRKSGSSSKDSGHSSSSGNGCIYEEVGKREEPKEVGVGKTQGGVTAAEAVYAQVDLEEKRRSRLNRAERFEPVDPPEWEGTYRSEGAYDEVDLEPIKLRELPPIPPIDEGVTYASLSLPLDPPPQPTVMKDNELYHVNEGLQV